MIDTPIKIYTYTYINKCVSNQKKKKIITC